MSDWTCALELSSDRMVTGGSYDALVDALRRGADMRVATAFRHNEHIEPGSSRAELIEETAEFPLTYVLDNHWGAGIMTRRQPISLPDDFGPRASMSFFLYNQDGQQAIARPHLDGQMATGAPGASAPNDCSAMDKYEELSNWDAATNAPSSNFIYNFEFFKYYVRDDWEEVLAHEADGKVQRGSLANLAAAARAGREVKVAVAGVCDDLVVKGEKAIDHELFVQGHSSYHYVDEPLFIIGTHPVVRVKPAIPLHYESRGWDFGWLMARSDGRLVRLLYDPYTLKQQRSVVKCGMRWLVR